MKKIVQSVTLCMLALTIFLTGMGVTIVDYCCSSCGGQTLIMVENHKCCDNNKNHSEKSCCSAKHENHKIADNVLTIKKISHCEVSRLSIDTDATSFRPHIGTELIWINDIDIPFLLFDTYNINIPVYVDYESPPDIPPKDYLTLHSTLII